VFSAGYVTAALDEIRAAGFGGYYWVLDQAEIATDVMFQSRPQLRASSIAIVAARIGLGLAVTGVIASVGFSAACLPLAGQRMQSGLSECSDSSRP
jgi:hypothetical protein